MLKNIFKIGSIVFFAISMAFAGDDAAAKALLARGAGKDESLGERRQTLQDEYQFSGFPP